jgi:cytochrome c oxidase subunit 2
MLGQLYLAQDLYVPPATETAREIASLFNLTLWIAIFVFVVVEGLLLYMIIRFRNNKKVPREESHRGHTTAEVVWTVIPAAILLFLGFLSAGTLMRIDTVPDDTDFTVRVEAFQFGWRFIYPDENGTAYADEAAWCRAADGGDPTRCSIGELRLQENSRVKVHITARDVIHAFAVPEFAIKQDAVPGKPRDAWFETPDLPTDAPVQYFIQCMEYCGLGHHGMRATLTVFPEGSQPLAYGRAPPPEPSEPTETTEPPS